MTIQEFLLVMTAIFSATVVPLWIEVRRLNNKMLELTELNGKIAEKLEDCIKSRQQAGSWQDNERRQRRMMQDDQLDPNKTPPPD